MTATSSSSTSTTMTKNAPPAESLSDDSKCITRLVLTDSPKTVTDEAYDEDVQYKGKLPPLPMQEQKQKTSESSSPKRQALDLEELKRQAGYKAVDDYVRSGQVIGLGTGSTAYYAVERVGQLLKSGQLQDIIAIPTSERTKEQALSLNIPLTTLDTHPVLDVAIDGADEVDLQTFHLIKGGGGAFLREKMVEVCAKKFIVIVDETKICDEGLGSNGYPIPIEITTFCYQHTIRTIRNLPSLRSLSCKPVLRMGSSTNNKIDGENIAITDNGNYIVDVHFHEPLTEASQLAYEIKNIVGVIEHGLFCHMTSAVIIASQENGVTTITNTTTKE